MARKILAAFAMMGAMLVAGCADELGRYNDPRGVMGVAAVSNAQVQDIHGPGLSLIEEKEVERLSADFRAAVEDVVYFDFDRSTLNAETRFVLDMQAQWLLENGDAAVRIYGHADLVGADPYNDRLGLNRARNVAKYLMSRGVSANRIQSVASLGERDPVVLTPDPERRNRRSLTAVVGLAYAGAPMRVSRAFGGDRAALAFQRYATDRVEKPRPLGTTGFVSK